MIGKKDGGDPLPKPNFEKPRHRCPFYGFSNLLEDQGGNQCSIYTGFYCCHMKTPNWEECSFHRLINEDLLKQIMDSKIYPEEFFPEEESSWGGMPFKDWMKYVMDDNTKRP